MKPGNLDDITIFENFIREWNDNSLSDENTVKKMVEKLSAIVYKYGRENWIKDIEQETFLKLSTCNYTGEGSLEGYIKITMKHLLFGMYRKEKENRRGEMPNEVRDEKEFDEFLTEFDEYFQEPLSDRVKMLLSETPENLWWYIEAVLGADRYISERQISEDLEISRYAVANARMELRAIWEEMEKEAE